MEQVGPLLDNAPFARCALDVAAHDLWGKLRQEPLWKLWGLRIDRLPPSDYTIGIDSPEVMLSKLAEMPGFPVYKIKLGGPQDLEVVAALRRHTDAAFRVGRQLRLDGRGNPRQGLGAGRPRRRADRAAAPARAVG